MAIDVSAFKHKPSTLVSFKEALKRMYELTKLSKRYVVVFAIVAISICGLLSAFDVLFISALLEEEPISILHILLLLFVNAAAVCIFLYAIYTYGSRAATMRRFAEQNGFEFKPFLNLRNASGTLFKLGTMEKHSRNGVAGAMNGINFMLFDYRFAIGAYRYRNVRLFTVLVLNTGIEFPSTLIENPKGAMRRLKYFDRSSKLENITWVPDGFAVFSKTGNPDQIKPVVNTEFLSLLSAALPNFDMELQGKDVYVYSEGLIKDPEAVRGLLEATKALRMQ